MIRDRSAGGSMELISVLLDFLRNLEGTLNGWAGQWGAWFYAVMFLVIFCETGLVVLPFLPGDSLLFALGVLCAGSATTLNLPPVLVLLVPAAALGDAATYAIGLRVGPSVFRSEKSWLLNKKHLLR